MICKLKFQGNTAWFASSRKAPMRRREGCAASATSKPSGAMMAPSFVRTHAECQYQFLKAIDEDRAPSPNLRDGLRIQAITEAAQRAAQLGRWVSVSELG